MKISACMIAKNEENCIAKCISSYKDIVDEIIVVDTGSNDKTVEIAESLGAKVYHFEWVSDFAKAKNYALSKATGDWIIFLDADEYFDLEKSKNIPKLIKKYGVKSTKLIGCKLINIDEKSGDLIGTFVQTRIFKKESSIYYTNSIHERLHSDEKNIKAVFIPENELEIFHTGYSKDIILEKAERNLTILQEEKKNNPTDATIDYFLCDTYISLNEYEKCVTFGEAFLKNRVNMIGLNSKVYQNIIAAMIKLGTNWEKIENVIQEALIEFPSHPMLHMFLSEKYFVAKQYEDALKSYERTLEMQTNYSDIEINFLDGKIHEIECPIARIYNYKNNEVMATDYYISALERKKDYIPAIQELIKLLGKLDISEAIPTFNRLYDCNNREEISILVEELTKQRSGKLLTHYINHMDKQFGHRDFSMVIMLLTNEKYEEAYKYFYEAYQINYDSTYARLAIVTALLNSDEQALMELRLLVKPSLKRIIEAVISVNNEANLYREDLREFLGILNEIILLDKNAYIDCFIDLKDKFGDDIMGIETEIGNILKDNGYYEKATTHYKRALESNNLVGEFRKDLKSLYFVIGYCYYKLRNTEQALNFFDEALLNGYLENDIRDFLLWIMEQTEVSEAKLVAKKLLDRFYTMKLENTEDKIKE